MLYGIGRNKFESEILAEKYTGALLIFGNSIIVLLIGIFLRKFLIKHNVFVGNIYLLSRIFESIALASIILNIFPNVNIPLDIGYFIGMIALGIGSIPMCYLFLKHRIVPEWLGIWGIIGYAIFAFEHINGILTINNLVGQQVYQSTILSTDTQIDISAFSSGSYYLRYMKDSNVQYNKIIKIDR